MSDQSAKKPQPDPAERNAFFPSSYSLSQFTSPKSDLSGADYPNALQGGKKILMIGADERYLLTDNGTFFSIGNHPVETLLPMYHLDKAASPFLMPMSRGIQGLQVPIFGPLGWEGAMSLGGERIDASPLARLAFRLIAESAFLAARRLLELPQDHDNRSLSDREREVLAWTAAGRWQVDIAATLGLSERTV